MLAEMFFLRTALHRPRTARRGGRQAGASRGAISRAAPGLWRVVAARTGGRCGAIAIIVPHRPGTARRRSGVAGSRRSAVAAAALLRSRTARENGRSWVAD
jgi:hypothetical protein